MTTAGQGSNQGSNGAERRGLMFVLSSPSGAGKTTLSRMLIDRVGGLQMSVSATTRAMRPGEVNTCCSKSNDIELTNTGLEMKNVVEQFREQVQNLE